MDVNTTCLKYCPTCPEEDRWHSPTTEYFHRNNKSEDKLSRTCKKCRRRYDQDRRNDPKKREDILAKDREYHRNPNKGKRSAWERVLENLDTSGGSDSCWRWMGSKDGGGYGMIMINGKRVKAHRFMWEHAFGPIPKDMLVCHTCDNPPCCNPKHLWLGTNQDNMDDMIAKGRSIGNSPRGMRHYTTIYPEKVARGEDQGSAKLTDELAQDIRAKYATGEYTQTQLAEICRVHQATVWRVIKGKTWQHTMEAGDHKIAMVRGYKRAKRK